MSFGDRLKHAWDALNDRDGYGAFYTYVPIGNGSSSRPDRQTISRGLERSLITAVYNRIALDCAQIKIEHVRLDDQGRFAEHVDSGLNNCLDLEANKDQTGSALIQDIVMSMFEDGDVAVVPTQTDVNIKRTGSYDIQKLRTAKILEWYPDNVKLKVYNEQTGKHDETIWPKSKVALIENPFRMIMNEPNSTVKRLMRKLAILDAIDEESGAGKLDLIIQLPYALKSEARRKEAEKRRADLQQQLENGKYGVAYTDGTEHIVQLNRPLENNLMKQIEYLVNLAYSQLGITTGIMDGSADAATMMNYDVRIIGAIMTVIVDEFRRKFLTKTARSQKQSIVFFRDPFKLVPVDKLADIADKFTRNEILSSNELRQIIGRKPVQDTRADELRNKNLNQPEEQAEGSAMVPREDGEISPEEEVRTIMERKNQNGEREV